MKFYLRLQFINVLPAFTTTPARRKFPFGRKIYVSDRVHKVHKVCKVIKFVVTFCFMNFTTFYSFAQTQQEFYTHKFNTYFSKDPKLADLVSIDEHGISIFS